MTMIEQMIQAIQGNQILSTVAGGSVIVWLMTNLKLFLGKTVDGVTALISFRIVNTYEDNSANGYIATDRQRAFNDCVYDSRAIWERNANFDLSTRAEIRAGRAGASVLAYGFSLRVMFGKIVVCRREINNSQKITVTTTLRVFFASKRRFLERLTWRIEQICKEREAEGRHRDSISVYNGECDCGRKLKRGMDSIFTNNDEHVQLLESIRLFLSNKEKYVKLAYPYNYSALLYGDPGCGKSSTILAIASALNKNITYVNMAKITLEKLIARLNSAHGDICVFEDIDALTAPVARSRDKKAGDGEESDDEATGAIRSFASSLVGISLSDLLNLTDGLLASDGTICLFTTNHIERLDRAFLRAGRMNKIVKFKRLNAATASRMIKANTGIEIPPDAIVGDVNPAKLQADILAYTLGTMTAEELVKSVTDAEAESAAECKRLTDGNLEAIVDSLRNETAAYRMALQTVRGALAAREAPNAEVRAAHVGAIDRLLSCPSGGALATK